MGKLLAGGVIIDDRNRVLLWRRNTPDVRQWELPGKVVDRGETPEEAVSEGLERTLGVDVWVGDIVCEAEFQQNSEKFKAALMTAKILNDESPQLAYSKVDSFGFFALNALEGMKREGRLSPSVERLMEVIAREDLTLQDFTP